ncbi:MAG: hypothetical protein COA44_03140 [Arcobacter sp.]|nr:MAG: hypothetical protein COA44_03140 [Arcobacter sp.]
MRVFIFIFLLFSNLLALENRQSLMDSISEYAIKIGTGPNKTYSFIDPLCSKSQAFIELIVNREDLQKETSYYIFLYELPRLHSKEYIIYIYQAKNPLEALKEVMIYQDYDIEINETSSETVVFMKKITEVAKQMDIKKWPYLLIYKKGSKYCLVSEGTAPCLEENDFQ